MFIVVKKDFKEVYLANEEWNADFLLPIKDDFETAYYIEDASQRAAAVEALADTRIFSPANTLLNKNNQVIATGREVHWPYNEADEFVGFTFKE